MNKLSLTDEQLNIVNKALEFYSRIGIGQFGKIKDHPTFEKHVESICTPEKKPEVGDRTPQGEILEIKKGRALIAGSVKNGMWCKEKEWKPVEEVVLSPNYSKYHELRDDVDKTFAVAKQKLYGGDNGSCSIHGGWGIFNPKVDESCRVAWDIYQVIRHERWKNNPNRNSNTVSASVCLTTKNANKIKCEIGR